MTLTKILGAALLCGAANVALACEFPPLVVIPAKEATVGKEDAIRAATATYFTAMQAYTKCLQDELAASGGDNAPPLTKAVLVQRNNLAVAEAQAVLKNFTDNVAPVPGPSPGPSPQPPAR
jgi:hypothetical protein